MDIKGLEHYIDQVMSEYRAVGLAARLFSRDGMLYENYFGHRNATQNLPIDCNTIFGMASISKSFTALSVMLLDSRGTLSIDDPVSRHLPEFKDTRVKISHLLTHSAGYFPMKRILVKDVAKELGIFDDGRRELGCDEQLACEGLKRVVERMNGVSTRIAPPGLMMSYSNDSYGLLSEIVHRKGGERSYGEFVRKNIFEPLGMTRSSVEFIRPAEDENCTDLHIYRQGLDGPCETSRDFYDNAFVLMGGGAVKSTPSDITRYIRMYMSQGLMPDISKRFVPSSVIRYMTTPRIEYRLGQWYGYGLSSRQIGGYTTWGHGGSLTGVSNFMIWDPRMGIGALVFANTSDVPASAVAVRAMRTALGLSLEEPPMPDIHWNKSMIERAAGYYESGEGANCEIVPDGDGVRLFVRGKETKCRMIMPGVLEIVSKLTRDEIMLIEDDDGSVSSVRMGGRIVPRAHKS